MSFKKDLSL